MLKELELITGDRYSDERGTLLFVNDFDMTQVKRMYVICHEDINVKRGWRGHRIEQRWFFAVEGSFEVRLVRIDNWESPDPDLKSNNYILTSNNPEVLHVPQGFASCLKASIPNSRMLIYADTKIDNAINDDYLFPIAYFTSWR